MVKKVLRKITKAGRERALNQTRRSLTYARSSASTFKREFRKHLVTAIAAALGFLIALSWREPLSDLTNLIIERVGLQGEALIYKFIAAIIVTILLVAGLIILTSWEVKKEEPKK